MGQWFLTSGVYYIHWCEAEIPDILGAAAEYRSGVFGTAHPGKALEFLERCSSPLTRSSGSSLALRSMFTEKNTTYQYPRAILSVDLSGESMCNHVMLKTKS